MTQKAAKLFISVRAGADADHEELDELARQLSDELAELDTLSTELPRGDALPEGAKGDPITIGSILVMIAEAGGITSLITVLGSWLSRDEQRSVNLQIGDNKIEVTGISEAEQTELIRWFQMQTGLQLDA